MCKILLFLLVAVDNLISVIGCIIDMVKYTSSIPSIAKTLLHL